MISSLTAAPRPLTGFSRRFGDLRVRPKLMVLHNGFFLILTFAVHFAVMRMVETRLAVAQAREVALILSTFGSLSAQSPQDELRAYDLKEGTAGELGLSDAARDWMIGHPGRTWQREPASDYVYKAVEGGARFYRITLPLESYRGLLASLKVTVFAVLGLVYVLAVLLLEVVILPRFVYQPMRLLLAADQATRDGDRASEIIPAGYIPRDEIGQIMESHNETVRKLRQREDELEAQDRLASLGLLSASVAHEMNTPLAVLHGSVEKLIETAEDASARARLERVLRVTKRLRSISEQLLDFARLRNPESGPVALRAIVNEAWLLVAIDEKAAQLRFVNNIPAGARVKGNAGRLEQVFVNLLRNAMQAAPAGGGEVAVDAAAEVVAGRASYRISVEDNGLGIPPEALPRVFGAFVSTRLDASGTGLGLTVAEGIVHQHGGSISASNRAGGGARLELILPAASEEQPHAD